MYLKKNSNNIIYNFNHLKYDFCPACKKYINLDNLINLNNLNDLASVSIKHK